MGKQGSRLLAPMNGRCAAASNYADISLLLSKMAVGDRERNGWKQAQGIQVPVLDLLMDRDSLLRPDYPRRGRREESVWFPARCFFGDEVTSGYSTS